MSQASKIPIPVTMVSTPHNAAITDSIIKEDSEDQKMPTTEDEDMPTTDDEVASITEISMVFKTVLTITPIPTIINLKSKNQPIKNTSRKPHIPKRFVISVVIQTTTQDIVTNGDQRTETNKYHIKPQQKTSEATPV